MEIRVLIWRLPNILRGIVQKILRDQSSFHVIAPVNTDKTVVEAVTEYRPDVVITCEENDIPERGGQNPADLLFLQPRLKVLAVRKDGREAEIWWLQPTQMTFEDISPECLVRVIRESGRNAEGTKIIHSKASTES